MTAIRGDARRSGRARQRELLWAGAVRTVSPATLDCIVRRSLSLPLPVAQAALIDVDRTMRAVPAAHRVRGRRRARRGWLELAKGTAVTHDDEHRLLGVLHVGRCGRVVPVEVVLAPWSTARSEVRLQPYRRVELPAHYFAVAHAVLDNLRDELHRRAFR